MILIQTKEKFSKEIKEEILRDAALAVFKQQNISDESELSIVIEDDAKLHALNLKHLGINKPTDVLSFPSGEIDPDSGQPYLGDVIISYKTALKQSTAGGHSISEELQLLVVHGCLHLLGYDHAEMVEKEKMWAIQNEILNALGVQVRPID